MFSAALAASLVLAVPHGWHAIRANPAVKASCDPVQLIVVGSERPRLGAQGWRAPRRGQVLVFLDDDHVNNPADAVTRPHRFRVPWRHLRLLGGCCGTPESRGWSTSFRAHGHLLLLMVFAGPGLSTARQRATERMLDSLRLR